MSIKNYKIKLIVEADSLQRLADCEAIAGQVYFRVDDRDFPGSGWEDAPVEVVMTWLEHLADYADRQQWLRFKHFVESDASSFQKAIRFRGAHEVRVAGGGAETMVRFSRSLPDGPEVVDEVRSTLEDLLRDGIVSAELLVRALRGKLWYRPNVEAGLWQRINRAMDTWKSLRVR